MNPGAHSGASPPLRERLWRIIFLSDTRAGRLFDVVLLWLIGLSVLTVMLESVGSIQDAFGPLLRAAEWAFTLIFTAEYVTRLAVVRSRWRYVSSFFGLVDLLAVVPTYLELLFPDAHYFLALRVLRMLRLFRVLKMGAHIEEAAALLAALRASRRKIAVFFVAVLSLVCVEGTMMYVVEHEANPKFSDIPTSLYWAIVTLTTVGYGDISPVTVLGKVMASIIMLTGFAIIAVPTGMVTAELNRGGTDARRCQECGATGHLAIARFCHQCGQPIAL
jgi:voltage-gated potassium channel